MLSASQIKKLCENKLLLAVSGQYYTLYRIDYTNNTAYLLCDLKPGTYNGIYTGKDILINRYIYSVNLITGVISSQVASQIRLISGDASQNFIANTDAPAADGKQLIRALNLHKTQDMISPDYYDATVIYNIGDIVIYQNDLYECNTAISAAEAWTAAHWTKTSVSVLVEKYKLHIIDLGSAQNGTISSDLLVKISANPQAYVIKHRAQGAGAASMRWFSYTNGNTIVYKAVALYQSTCFTDYIYIYTTDGHWTVSRETTE